MGTLFSRARVEKGFEALIQGDVLPQQVDALGRKGALMLSIISWKLSRKGRRPTSTSSLPCSRSAVPYPMVSVMKSLLSCLVMVQVEIGEEDELGLGCHRGERGRRC